MDRIEFPPVHFIDLGPRSTLAAVVAECARSHFRLVCATSSEAGHQRVAIVCAPAIDAATESRIARVLSRLDGLLVLLVAETVEVEVVSRLLSGGARDYVSTSGHAADIVPRLRRLFSELPRRPASAVQGAGSGPLARMVGVSEARQNLVDQIVRAAKCDLTVLIEGETGVGKGVCAEVIHARVPGAAWSRADSRGRGV